MQQQLLATIKILLSRNLFNEKTTNLFNEKTTNGTQVAYISQHQLMNKTRNKKRRR
jgi:hypothetical protein